MVKFNIYFVFHFYNLTNTLIKKQFQKFSLNYIISSFIISFTIFLILIFVTNRVRSIHFYELYVIFSLSILIGYQLAGIKYFFSNIKSTLEKIRPYFKNEKFQIYCYYSDKKFQKSNAFYILIILIIIPFILIEILKLWEWKFLNGPIPLYYSLFFPSNPWSIILDIINHIVGYLMLLLLAIIIWIIINLIAIVIELNKDNLISIDIFHIDGIGGLSPLRNFILFIVSNYFIIITLAIISYISPITIISFETIFLICMLFLGVLLFLTTQKTIKTLIKKGIECELSKINEEYKKNYDKLIYLIANDDKSTKRELERLSFILDTLEKEKIRIKQKTHRKFDFRTIATFISSFLIPTITMIEKIIGISSILNYFWSL